MHSFSIKSLLATLMIGILAGACLRSIMVRAQSEEAINHSNDLIDFVIAQWTGGTGADSVDVGAPGYEAQFSAAKELPMSRLGFFPDTVRALAAMVEARYKVPSAVTLAQWALESRWGKNNLGVSNYFGHTYAATKTFIASPKFVVFHELINASGTSRPGRLVKFASYRSITECFDAHGQYLSTSQLYRDAFFATNAEQFAKIISLHYATDPDYATKLITIIRRYKLS